MRRRTGLIALLTATTISVLGSRMTAVAVPWLVLSSTGSAALTGVTAAAGLLPYAIASGLIGPLVDRIGSRRVSVAADAASAVVVGAIPVMHAAGHLPFGLLLALVAVAGVLRGCGDTAKNGAILPQSIAESGIDTTRVTSLDDGLTRAGGMLGTIGAGGLIVWLGGATDVIVADALSFAICALMVATLVRVGGPIETHDEEPERYVSALRSGLAYVRSDRLALGITLMLFVTNLLDQAYSAVLVPLWAHDVYRSPVGIGLISASAGIGALVGSVVYTALAPRLPRWAPFTIGFIVAGAPKFLVLGLGASVGPIVVVGFFSGVAVCVLNPILGAVILERVPGRMLARVNGLGIAVSIAGTPVGALLGGWLGGYGARLALLIVGGTYGLATLTPFFGRFWRQMDDRPPLVAPVPELVGEPG